MVKALNARAKRRFVEIDPGLEAYKRGIYMHILLAFKEGCRWNNFKDVGGTISLTNGMHRLYQKQERNCVNIYKSGK